MSNYAPIKPQVLDESGQELFAQSVPFELELAELPCMQPQSSTPC
jgi:hypothetical protein